MEIHSKTQQRIIFCKQNVLKMYFNVLSFLRFFCELLCYFAAKYITRCKKHDAQMTQCLTKAVEVLHPRLKTGIPEMHIPAIEPLTVQSISFDSGSSFKAHFEDIKVFGLSSFQLKDVKFDFDSKTLDLVLDFYDLKADSNYKISGKLLFLELDGSGFANGTASKFQFAQRLFFFKKIISEHAGAVVKLVAKTKTVKGKEYLYFDNIDLDLTLDGGFLYLDNVIKNNPEISANTNKIIADNIDNIISELKPVIQKSFEEIIMGLLEKVMERYSIDELFAND